MRFWCGRNCKECMSLRIQQKANCVRKRDDPATLSIKRKEGKDAEKGLIAHLNDLTLVDHEIYDQTLLFPPKTLVWENGGYNNRDEETVVERPQEDLDFVEELKEQRSDFLENHFVGVVPRKRRDAGGYHGRPDKILLGYIVVVRNDTEEDLPWYLGEVVKESEEGSNEFTICEYGPACQKKQTDPTAVKWAARFQGTEKIWVGNKQRRNSRKEVEVTRDEYHMDAKAKPSKKEYKPLLKVITADNVVEWDTQEKFFKKLAVPKHSSQSKNRRRRNTGRTLRKWVLTMVAMNPRVAWDAQSSDEEEEEKNTLEEKEGYGEGASASSSSSSSASSSSASL